MVLCTLVVSRSQAQNQVSLTGLPYNENFNTLAASGTSSATPLGWSFFETGTTPTPNTTYTAGTGSGNAGDTYSFGPAGNTDRAFGGLQSGALNPTIGVTFINNTGAAITSLTISYYGEQWRLGALGRVDRMDFQYSLDATALNNGTWTNADALDFTAPVTAGTTGALDGNNALNRSLITSTITGLNIPNGSTFILRWTDFNATGADDGLSVDDFSLSYVSGVANTVTLSAGTSPAEPATNGTFNVTLNNPAPAGGVTITYALTGTATAGADYTDAGAGTLVIAQGNTSGVITATVIDDALNEGTETLIGTLVSATAGYSINTTPVNLNFSDNESSSLAFYPFSACSGPGLISDGFIQFSKSGAQNWDCTNFGFSTNAIQMNGFASGAAQTNEDWLISPALNLSATTFPLLSFYSRTKFAGPSLKLLVSTNYSGSGDPALATWTEINGKFPATHSDVWTLSSNINLSAFKQTNVYIAFRYTSNASEGASRWTIDEINLSNALVAPAPSVTAATTLVDLRQANFGGNGLARPFAFWADNTTNNLTITAPAGFELSKDGVGFSGSVSYTPAETQNLLKTLQVRLTPQSANNSYSGFLQFSAAGLNAAPVFVKGHSFPTSQTLNVVNWNIEWFGSTAVGQGPTDDNQAQANAKTTMDYINADAYALAEIVDVSRLASLTSSLVGGYSYVVADYCSSGSTPAACATSQKLAFVYKTSVFSNVTARAFLDRGPASTSYTNWASGRYPYLVTATVNKNGFTRNINFIVLHAKAQGGGTEVTDYNRRKGGADEMKDTLDTHFSDRNLVILGDFNDDLDSTIVPAGLGINPRLSSYTTLTTDSTDANSYRSVTMPLSLLSKTSTYSNSEFIDHVVISNELAASYIPYSASLYDDIGALAGITDFSTTTSDHYPVLTSFLMSSILPSQLSRFEATRKDNKALITWTTAQELNSKSFVIERSADGRNFQSIATVDAAGQSAFARNYQYTDAQPAAGVNYYRLKMVDNDGKLAYSRIVTLYFGKDFFYSVAPNPARNLVWIQLENNPGPLQLQLTDLNGRLLKQVNVGAAESQTVKLPVHDLSKGVYVLKVSGTNYVKTTKLIID